MLSLHSQDPMQCFSDCLQTLLVQSRSLMLVTILIGGIDMNATEEILDLLETNGQSGPDMTQALKAIGGDMKSNEIH